MQLPKSCDRYRFCSLYICYCNFQHLYGWPLFSKMRYAMKKIRMWSVDYFDIFKAPGASEYTEWLLALQQAIAAALDACDLVWSTACIQIIHQVEEWYCCLLLLLLNSNHVKCLAIWYTLIILIFVVKLPSITKLRELPMTVTRTSILQKFCRLLKARKFKSFVGYLFYLTLISRQRYMRRLYSSTTWLG